MSKQTNLSQEDIKAKVEYLSSHRCNHTLHKYIDISGDLIAGTLLSQIMYWFSTKNGKSKVSIYRDGHYWLAKRREDWMDEIRISKKQYDCAIKKLTAEIEPTKEEKEKNPGNKGKRREKKFDNDKALVEVKTFHFHGIPMTHIRPITENINRMVAEWEETLAKEIAGEDDDTCNLNSPNGNLANTPNVNMENDETENCYNIYNNINNTDTEITNRNYNTENTLNSFSNEKDNSKPNGLEFYNSEVGELRTDIPEPEEPNSPKTNITMTLGKRERPSRKHELQDMPTRAKEIAYRLTEDEKLSDKSFDCVKYFIDRYKANRGREHVDLRNDTLERVVTTMLSTITVPVDGKDGDYFENDYSPLICYEVNKEDFKQVIDKYFATEFSGKTDYSIVHFLNENVLPKIMNKCSIGNGYNWYESHEPY